VATVLVIIAIGIAVLAIGISRLRRTGTPATLPPASTPSWPRQPLSLIGARPALQPHNSLSTLRGGQERPRVPHIGRSARWSLEDNLATPRWGLHGERRRRRPSMRVQHFWADFVAKRFCSTERARLIQEQKSLRNLDSKIQTPRFYCCIFLFYNFSSATFATKSAQSC
jgi:hypothetical protein